MCALNEAVAHCAPFLRATGYRNGTFTILGAFFKS